MSTPEYPAPPVRRQLRRSRTDRVVAGVCAGIAQQLDIDPLVVRIAVVAVTLISGGAAALAYLIAWMLIPRDETPPA